MKKVFGLFIVSLLAAGSAHAEADRWEISLQPGIFVPTGETGDLFKKSGTFAASGMVGITEWTSVGLELGYVFSAPVKDEIPGFLEGDLSILQFTPQIKIGPMLQAGSAKIHPYVMAGGGLYRSKLDLTYLGVTDSGTNTNGGFNFGAGIMILPTPQFGIGFDWRYHRILYNDVADDEYFVPSVKLSFFFSE